MAAAMNMLRWLLPKRIPIKFYRPVIPKNNHIRCCSRLVTQEQSEYSLEPEYPPIKPRWPPGKWGEMEDKDAWEFYLAATKFQDLRILHEKLDALTDHEKIYSMFKTNHCTPKILRLHESVTKTAVIEGLPPVYDGIPVDEEFKILKSCVLDAIVREYHAQIKPDVQGKESHVQECKHSKGIIPSIVNILFAVLAGKNEHLLRSQLDRDARIECFWSKLFEEDPDTDDSKKTRPGVDKYKRMGCQLQHVAELMLRTEQPLPEFLPRDDNLCVSAEVQDYKYHPLAAAVPYRKIKPSVVAGYKTKNQFWDGSPCEFGHISFHSCKEVADKRLEHGQDIDNDYVTSMGLLASFGWTVAQAYNQGFDWMNDVTYPFTTQTVVTNGRKITFFAYQLNTMLLWKNNDCNPLRNIMWSTPEMQLFDSIDGDTVVGFNDEALRILIKMFKHTPVDRGIDLRPYLSKDYEPLKAVPNMNIKGEPVIERPHPPRLFSKSKKVKVISPIVTTEEKIKKKWERGNWHWNEKTQRFDVVERK